VDGIARYQMSKGRCKRCGTPRSKWLDGNCPNCLLELGATSEFDEDTLAGGGEIEIAAGEKTKLLGGYELLNVIGQGGMGVVYRARQRDLRRIVAVKVLLGGLFAKDASVERFRREAEAAASISHPNIVPIYEVGEHDGQPFFSMELIAGRDLGTLARDKPLAATEAARLVMTIAEAVQFAHERGVLHRDLKPSNILVDESRQPHITDFGFAKRLTSNADASGEEDQITASGEVFGTPNYMPPEQANPRLGPATAASDVYSLGAILYQLLTARPPFLADSITETLRLAAESEPASPRMLNPSVPQDLETICLRCLERNPRQRYSSARELADELDRYLAGEPIHARPSGPVERALRWCRRKPALARTLGAAILLLLLILTGLPIALVRINNARQAAEASNGNYRQELYSALLDQARATVLSGEMGHRELALKALKQAGEITNSAELRRVATTAFALPDLKFERTLPLKPAYGIIVFDPEFERFAACLNSGPIDLCSAIDGSVLGTLPCAPGRCSLASWDSTGRYLATRRDDDATKSPIVEVWDTREMRLDLSLREGVYRAIAFAPSQPILLTVSLSGIGSIWDVEKKTNLIQFNLPIRQAPIRDPRFGTEQSAFVSLAFSPDGSRVAVAYSGRTNYQLSIIRCADGALIDSFDSIVSLTDVAWNRSGDWICTADWTGTVTLIDPSSRASWKLRAHKAQAVRVAFNPLGDYLLTSGWDREIVCWDWLTQQRLFSISRDSFVFQLSKDGSKCMVITPSGCEIYSFGRPSFSCDLSEALGRTPLHAAFSMDGRWLAASDQDAVHVWDLETKTMRGTAREGGESDLFFSRQGELYASGIRGWHRWRVDQALTNGVLTTLQSLPLPSDCGAVSLAVGESGIVLNSTNGSRLIVPGSSYTMDSSWRPTVRGLGTVSPDDTWYAVFEPYSKILNIYRLPEFEPVARLTNRLPIRMISFLPQGGELCVSTKSAIEFWGTTNWQRTRCLTNFMELRIGSRSGAFWLTGDFTSAGLHDSATLEPLLPLPKGTTPLALSPDERWLAVTAPGGKLQVWDLVELRHRLGELGLDWKVR
jgi:serine/threonine protein kinase/WD40 repeat protein